MHILCADADACPCEDLHKCIKISERCADSGFDIRPLTRSGRFEADASGSRVRSLRYPDMNITFLTAHSSKGLGFDHVILLNGRDGIYGFPAKIPDDPVLSFVIKKDPGIAHAEERRLFYVAMTRTKNRVYIIAPAKNPSEFVKELMRENRSVKVRRSRG